MNQNAPSPTILAILALSSLAVAAPARTQAVANAVQDAWVSPTTGVVQNGNPLFVGRDDFGTQDTLLQFSFPAVDPDSVIIFADLFLHRQNGSLTTGQTHPIRLIIESWNETTVTHANRPDTISSLSSSTANAANGEDDTANVLTFVRSWVNQGADNFGLEVRGDSGASNYFVSYGDRTQASEQRPIIVFGPLAPVDQIDVPLHRDPVTVDADCDTSEYQNSLEVPWISFFMEAFSVHTDGSMLYVCGTIDHRSGGDLIALHIDPQGESSATVEMDDFRFVVDPTDGMTYAERGNGAGGWTGAGVPGWSAAGGQPPGTEFTDAFEFAIPLSAISANASIRMSLHHTDGPDRRGWPRRTVEDEPLAWVLTDLFVFRDDFESGNLSAWSSAVP